MKLSVIANEHVQKIHRGLLGFHLPSFLEKRQLVGLFLRQRLGRELGRDIPSKFPRDLGELKSGQGQD